MIIIVVIFIMFSFWKVGQVSHFFFFSHFNKPEICNFLFLTLFGMSLFLYSGINCLYIFRRWPTNLQSWYLKIFLIVFVTKFFLPFLLSESSGSICLLYDLCTTSVLVISHILSASWGMSDLLPLCTRLKWTFLN